MASYRICLFQSRTGFPGHLAIRRRQVFRLSRMVSIPNGLPRPFSLFLSSLYSKEMGVSIPNGLPRPFSLTLRLQVSLVLEFQSRTGFPGHLAKEAVERMDVSRKSFNPERASQAI